MKWSIKTMLLLIFTAAVWSFVYTQIRPEIQGLNRAIGATLVMSGILLVPVLFYCQLVEGAY